MNMENLCRVCLTEQTPLKSLFGGKNCLANRISSTFNLDFEILSSDNYPGQICLNCLTELHCSFQFYEKIRNSEDRLSIMFLGNEKEQEEEIQEHETLEQDTKGYSDAENNEDGEGEGEYTFEEYLVETTVVEDEGEGSEAVKVPIVMKEEIDGQTLQVFNCPECPKMYVKRASYIYHMKTKHSKSREFECPVCFKAFAIKGDCSRHMRIHDKNDKRFVCSVCGKAFTDRSTHIKHEKIHTGHRPFKCELCDKAFAHKFVLNNHMLSHSSQKDFPCPACHKCFSRKAKMKDHFLRIHKRPFGPEEEELFLQKYEKNKAV